MMESKENQGERKFNNIWIPLEAAVAIGKLKMSAVIKIIY